jgi:hypothetical protein
MNMYKVLKKSLHSSSLPDKGKNIKFKVNLDSTKRFYNAQVYSGPSKFKELLVQ